MKMKYHIVLTPNEPEIIALKKSLPQGELSKTVATIMTESLKDKVATIPMNFEIEPVIEDVHISFSSHILFFGLLYVLYLLLLHHFFQNI